MIFRITALLLMVVFYGCYFCKRISQKKKGITTSPISSGKTRFVKGIECTMMASAIIVVIVELVSIVLGTTLLSPWVRWLGVGISAVSVAVFITAVITTQNNWRVGMAKSDKTELVTNGIFSLSRNPLFLDFDLLYFGILLMLFCRCSLTGNYLPFQYLRL
jgi:protein-S-isoprenylcysteine O-methyltransferase Ste14